MNRKFTKSALLFLGLIAITLTSCNAENNKDQNKETSTLATEQAANKDVAPKQATTPKNARSWQVIKQSGVIRALKLDWEDEHSLPRSGSTSLVHIQLVSQFAESNGLSIEWVKVSDLNQMFKALENHKADIIPRHLSITEERLKKLDFTLPLGLENEILIGKENAQLPNKADSIRVDLISGTSFIESVKNHSKNWKVEVLSRSYDSESLADLISNGQIDFSVLDESAVKTLLNYRTDIKALYTFPDKKEFAWAVAKGNLSFVEQLNLFISEHHFSERISEKRKLDLSEVKKKRLPLRMITRNSPETYFLWRGELMGFEYELMRAFAKQHKVRLEVVVAKSYQEMLDLLAAGKGDFIAAGLSRTSERKSDLTFSIRYNRVAEKLVAHKESKPIIELQDLKNRTIVVRKSSAFWQTAVDLKEKYGVNLQAADEFLSTEILISKVANKEIDLTIADSNLISIEESFRDNIVSPVTLKENIPYAYVVRKNNPQLLNALNQFIQKEYRKTFYNVVKNKYFASSKEKKKHRQERLVAGAALSPFDDDVRKTAKDFQFDWRLIISQMYQESRFNPDAQSNAGALGLMQVLPRTAEEMGIDNLKDPQQSIAAGVQYLNWTRQRFSADLPLQERIFFALASYNAGYGHVKDARRLAKSLSLDPNKWFNNVEKAMLLLQQPQYYQASRFGYCRGSEPVNYVREIHQRYLGYIDVAK